MHCRWATLTDIATAHTQRYISLLEASANNLEGDAVVTEFISSCLTEGSDHSDIIISSSRGDSEAVSVSATSSRHPDVYLNKNSFQASLASSGSAITLCDAICNGNLIADSP